MANHFGKKVSVKGTCLLGVGGLVPGRGTVGMLEARRVQEACQPEDPVHTAVCMSLAAHPGMSSCLLILLPAAFLVALFRYLQICLSLPLPQPWHQAPLPDRLTSCPNNMSLLALRICGHWAGLASEFALTSATAFPWPAFFGCVPLCHSDFHALYFVGILL